MSPTPARHCSVLPFLPRSMPRLVRGVTPGFCFGLLLSALAFQSSSALAADLPASPPAPAPYEAEYEARAMGMRTDAYRRLERIGDNEFRLSHGLSVSVLGANMITVEEKSQFSWDEEGAVPLVYSYKQTGVRRRDERVNFDWTPANADQPNAHMIRDGREQNQAINKATLDNLSFSAQISADLMNKPQLRAADTMLSYEILDARRLETHEYRVLGAERISTPAGELDTIKLERIRDSDSGRTTLIWLAADQQFTLAKLSQTEGGGSAMELNLKRITWTGDASGSETADATAD
ncbi:MAG: DUF3108 domain-containing protein [Pseudohongiella sp.]|nr:DUF3108 domain-containing protein [Pseudohongiella sp.]